MSNDREVTILHLSDLQFGANHYFATAQASDGSQDSLAQRITKDLDGLLHHDQSLRPNLILVTGDVAEKGRPSEFRAAADFLRAVSAYLRIDPSRVIVLPGNHDVNRDECAAYFQRCAASETQPEAPFWPKWQQWTDFLHDFYGESGFGLFTKGEPWNLFEIFELKVVVAVMNSTIAESHRDDDHYGWIGEAQMSWFAEHAETYREKGWLRIGALHHNVRRGPVRDDENLRDADALRRTLGESFNMLFHGHTHDGQLDWLMPIVPILSTGSAAVTASSRPEQTPNQYQIVRIRHDGFTRYARAYVPTEKRWVGDTRASTDGRTWMSAHAVRFDGVSATFDIDDSLSTTGVLSALGVRQNPDDFLSRVARVAILRERTGAEVERIRDLSGHEYLRISVRDGDIRRIFPVGASPKGPAPDVLDEFARKIHASYAEDDTGLISYFVYGGHPRASAELTQQFAAHRVHLMSFVEYEGLLDFRDYVRDQTALLENDPLYPPSLYVPQRMRYAPIDGQRETDDALQAIADWLATPQSRFVLLLGEFGTGKTFLMHELARRMGTEKGGLIPILIQLRDLEKGRTLDQLIAQHFAQKRMDEFRSSKFRYMLEHGRVALLFDGFDELAIRVTYAKAAEHLETLLQAATGAAKVVVTSRTQHFVSDQQIKTAMGHRVDTLAGRVMATLDGFDDKQVILFLERKLGSKSAAQARFTLIRQVRDLLGLSHSPRMLGFIAELSEETLQSARSSSSDMTQAQVYHEILDRWLVQEFDRIHPRGAQSGLSVEDRWNAVTELAIQLWRTAAHSITLDDLTDHAASILKHLATSEIEAAIATFQVGSGTLLVRDEEGNFSFMHQSILEWLVASRIAAELQKLGDSAILAERELSSLMADFLVGLTSRDHLVAWAQKVLVGEEGDVSKKNAMLIRAKLGVEQDSSNTVFARQDLRGADFSGHGLTKADFTGADLTESRFAGAVLDGATLDGASCVSADFSKASLVGASINHTDFSRANLTGADLRQATIKGTNFHRTKLIGAHLDDEGPFSNVGAALRAIKPVSIATTAPLESVRSVAWSVHGDLFASSGEHFVRIWDASSGLELRQIEEPSATAVRFLGERSLITVNAGGLVKMWVLDTGKHETLCEGRGALTCLDASKAGDVLVFAGSDARVFVWMLVDGEWSEKYCFRASAAIVNSVSISSDNVFVAAAANDRIVHVWNLRTGEWAADLRGHGNFARAVAFVRRAGLPFGSSHLLSGSSSGEVFAWTIAPDNSVKSEESKSHAGPITQIAVAPDQQAIAIVADVLTVVDLRTSIRYAVENISRPVAAAFSPSGDSILIGSVDGTVRVWDRALQTTTRTVSGRGSKAVWVRFSADGHTILSSSAATDYHLWDARTGEEWWADTAPPASGVALTTLGGKPTVTLLFPNEVSTREIMTGREVMKVGLPTGGLVGTGHEGRLVAITDENGTVQVLRLNSGEQQTTFKPRGVPVAIALSPSERLLAIGTRNLIEIFDTASGETLATANIKLSDQTTMEISADERHLAVAYGGIVNVLRLERTVMPLFSLRHSNNPWEAITVAFHPSRPLLLSGGQNGTVAAWNLITGGPISRLPIHRAQVTSIAMSPDGQKVASASTDGKIVLWGFDHRVAVATLVSFHEGWAAYTPSGAYKFGGNIAGLLWHTIGLCRFDVGELDDLVPWLHLPDATPIDEV